MQETFRLESIPIMEMDNRKGLWQICVMHVYVSCDSIMYHVIQLYM